MAHVAYKRSDVVSLGFSVGALLTPLDQRDSVVHIHNDTAVLFQVKVDGHTFSGLPSLETAVVH